MPPYQLTLDDTSPLISYSSDWTAGTSASDASAFRYSQSTFHATDNAGATASLSFNGTGIQIFGAKRDNHGQYQVRIDNDISSAQNGQDTTNQFQAILYEVHGLPQGRHDVSIMNLGNQQFLDIDFITIEGNIGDANKKLFVNTIQDTESSFSYIPSEAQWITNPTNLGSYSGSSGHATSNPGSQVAFQFIGDGVSLYGPMGTNGSPYTVELDGVPAQNLSTASDRYIPQSLLYHASGLGDGPHRLVMKYAPTSSGQVFAVDYAQVYTTRGPISSANNSNSNLSGGAIVGIILAVAVIIGALIAIAWLLLRRRKQRNQFVVEDNEKSSDIGLGPGPVYPFVSQPPPAHGRGVSRSNTHSTFGPGPSSAFPLADYPQNAQEMERSMTISSTGARTMVGSLSVNTNLSHGTNALYRSQAQYPNQLGLMDGPFSPEEGNPSDSSPSDLVSQANLLSGRASNGRFMLGSNGYPLEKVPRTEAEEIISPVAGPSSSMHPFAFPAPMEQPQLRQPSGGGGGNSADDELNPPDYAHATGGPRVR